MLPLLATAICVLVHAGCSRCGPKPQGKADGSAGSTPSARYVLEDFSDIVTLSDLGLNDFSGNMGAINPAGFSVGTMSLVSSDGSPRLQFAWDFTSAAAEAFTGLFFSLFGLTDTLATFDAKTIAPVRFPEHTVNFDRIDGELSVTPRRFLRLVIELDYAGIDNLNLRMELKNPDPGTGISTGRFWRFPVKGSPATQTIVWDFRDRGSFRPFAAGDLDLSTAKVLTLILERWHVANDIHNPDTGNLSIRRISFQADQGEPEPASDQDLLSLAERHAIQYFIDWSSRKAGSLGLPQDRSTSADLLTVGGVGFALPAYVIAAERGWLSNKTAVARVLAVLRLLDDESLQGPEPVGRLGYKGAFYHFLGVDGRRKLNFDYPETPDRNEALNTVELSTIDTALAIWGVLVAQSYFAGSSPEEAEIRSRAQSIYDRVDWRFFYEPLNRQLYLGWKPNELRDEKLGEFKIRDADKAGSFSGTPTAAQTLDYYTDEALLALILGVGSQNHAIPREAYCALKRHRSAADSLVKTWPGSLFTYQFLHSFLNTRSLGLSACPGNVADDWYTNSQLAQSRAVAYAGALEGKLEGFGTYGATAWGVTAAEGPDDEYRANAAPLLAASPKPEQNGTVAYYGMVSAITFGPDLRAEAIAALRAGWTRGHWHPRFGLPDAFHGDVSRVPASPRTLRASGAWVNRALFAIDEGPMALALANDRDGLVWRLTEKNSNVQRGIAALRTSFLPSQLFALEGENASGRGTVSQRSNASGSKTLSLHKGEAASWSFTAPARAHYALSVRYSNDNNGPLEKVGVFLDGTRVARFDAKDSGNRGRGRDWNTFLSASDLADVNVLEGKHTLEVRVSGGDGYGVEIDVVTLSLRTRSRPP
jgi:hypothetical protein